jgi:hypothetical protein
MMMMILEFAFVTLGKVVASLNDFYVFNYIFFYYSFSYYLHRWLIFVVNAGSGLNYQCTHTHALSSPDRQRVDADYHYSARAKSSTRYCGAMQKLGFLASRIVVISGGASCANTPGVPMRPATFLGPLRGCAVGTKRPAGQGRHHRTTSIT